MTDEMDKRDADRLQLLDRIAERVPELDLDERKIEWDQMPDGAEALVVDGGGFTGDGNGMMFANAGEDVHAIGSLAPLIDGMIGCVALKPNGDRLLMQAVPDPLAQ